MTKDGAFNYIAGRAATYFVSLMHGTTFTRTRFWIARILEINVLMILMVRMQIAIIQPL